MSKGRNLGTISTLIAIFAICAVLLLSSSYGMRLNQSAWAATPPDTTINSATDSEGNTIENLTSTTSDSITFTFSSPDSDVSQFQCNLDNAKAWQDCTSPISYSNLAGGEHTFSVRAIDAEGNPDPGPPIYVWTVQITPAQAIDKLISTVQKLDNVPQGTKTSLAAPLQAASNILNDDNPNNDKTACGELDAFIMLVNASERRGNLTKDQAADLITQAEDIRSQLRC